MGLDPDEKALARARRKADREVLGVQLDHGYADQLPYPEASFDRVCSAFMLHHLPLDEKAKALREARRVLRRGGALYALDFGGEHGVIAHLFHHAHLEDQARIPALMRDAGFAEVTELAPRATILGRVAYWRASG